MDSIMMEENIPQWLVWAREIQALAQTGNNFVKNEFDAQRYDRLTEIAAEIISQHTGLSESELVEKFKDQRGYATPKVDVRGAVFNEEGKLLMVKERMDGTWAMPGGWGDVGDVPSEGAQREVWEEAGFKVKATKVVGVYDANRIGDLSLFHAFKIIFLCDLISGEARPSNETTDVRFFALDEIPVELLGTRTTIRMAQDAFAAHQNPELPTVFD
jgi:ADP-ribose pyrophosphatase YjhB (NUDIX family)